MGIFDWLRRRKTEKPPVHASSEPEQIQEASEPDPPQEEERVSLFSDSGTQVQIDRASWRKVLLNKFSEDRDDPEKLFAALVTAIKDDLVDDCEATARRLLQIDPEHRRATTLLAHVLTQTGKADEAEGLLLASLAEHGEDAVVRNNLAKVYAVRGEDDRVLETLRECLELDPNEENSLQWWVAIKREREGEEAARELLREIAERDGSWRASIWLARMEIEEGQIEMAVSRFRQVLASASVDGEALTTISGDLARAGHLDAAIELVDPVYEAQRHGPYAGLNLTMAHAQTGNLERARAVLDEVEALHRRDLLQHVQELREQLDQLSG